MLKRAFDSSSGRSVQDERYFFLDRKPGQHPKRHEFKELERDMKRIRTSERGRTSNSASQSVPKHFGREESEGGRETKTSTTKENKKLSITNIAEA